MTTLQELGAEIRQTRKAARLTVEQLAGRCGIHRNTLAAFERGVGNVEINTLLAICAQLGLELVLAPSQIAGLVTARPQRLAKDRATGDDRRLDPARADPVRIHDSQVTNPLSLSSRIAAMAQAGMKRPKGAKK